jgi:hypothetical protein
MESMELYQFINKNGDELIRRCRAKAAKRPGPPAVNAQIDKGVPLFLTQLSEELRDGAPQTLVISESAKKYGHDLLTAGFTISQVVHGYGDVCQSLTDLAVETGAPISTDDFRTLNRCLDDAIAGAVTEYARAEEVSRDGESQELSNLINTSITAFEVLQTGNVGVGGSTGAVLLRSLKAIGALVRRQSAKTAPPVTDPKPR